MYDAGEKKKSLGRMGITGLGADRSLPGACVFWVTPALHTEERLV